MIVYTLVCTKCTRGWQSDQSTGTCKGCGEEAILRETYRAIPL